jgi:hypothetical protein
VVAFVDEGKNFEKDPAVLTVFEYGFSIISLVGDMIYRSGRFDP